MNRWVSSTTDWIPDAIYMKGNEQIDMDVLEGRDCYAGLDLSSTGDIIQEGQRGSGYDERGLLVPETAAGQTERIKKAVRSLEQMPMRHRLYEEEAWHSQGLIVLQEPEGYFFTPNIST